MKRTMSIRKPVKIIGAIGASFLISTASVGATIAWYGKADLDAVYKLTQEYVQKKETRISELEGQVQELTNAVIEKDNTINELSKKVEDFEHREEHTMEELAEARENEEMGRYELNQANEDVAQFREDMEELLGADEGSNIEISGGSIGYIPDSIGEIVEKETNTVANTNTSVTTSNTTNDETIKQMVNDLNYSCVELSTAYTNLQHGDTNIALLYLQKAIPRIDSVRENMRVLQGGISSEELEELYKIRDAYYQQSIELEYYRSHYGDDTKSQK